MPEIRTIACPRCGKPIYFTGQPDSLVCRDCASLIRPKKRDSETVWQRSPLPAKRKTPSTATPGARKKLFWRVTLLGILLVGSFRLLLESFFMTSWPLPARILCGLASAGVLAFTLFKTWPLLRREPALQDSAAFRAHIHEYGYDDPYRFERN